MNTKNNEAEFIVCKTKEDFMTAKQITRDYMIWLNMDISYQNTKREFALFETMYGYPEGCYIIAKINNKIAGGIACRKLNVNICEMKRLYVYKEFQGKGIGKHLCFELIKTTINLNYKKMRLDTVAKLKKAIALYKTIGFYEIPKYVENPDRTVSYMELDLQNYKIK